MRAPWRREGVGGARKSIYLSLPPSLHLPPSLLLLHSPLGPSALKQSGGGASERDAGTRLSFAVGRKKKQIEDVATLYARMDGLALIVTAVTFVSTEPPRVQSSLLPFCALWD